MITTTFCRAGRLPVRISFTVPLLFAIGRMPALAGNGCQWSPSPQFTVSITTTPANRTVRPCESVTFNIAVSTMVNQESKPGDWDKCHLPGYPDTFYEDKSLTHVLTADGGTINGDTWTAPDTYPPRSRSTIHEGLYRAHPCLQRSHAHRVCGRPQG